jgi:hypothetical protein
MYERLTSPLAYKLTGGEGQKSASDFLQSIGIHGIRYLDAGSRNAQGDPTHNYVVFDHNRVSVKRKYAQGGDVEAYGDGGETSEFDPDQKYNGHISHIKYLPTHAIEHSRMAGEVHFVSDDVARNMDYSEPVETTAFRYNHNHDEHVPSVILSNGHHRLAAAKQMGVPYLPVTVYAQNAKGHKLNALKALSDKIERNLSNLDITKSEGGDVEGYKPHQRAEEQGYSIKGYHFTRGPKAQSIAKSKQFDPYLSEGEENATFFWDNPQAANDWAHFRGGVDPNKPQEKMTSNELDRLSRVAPSMFPVRIHPGKHTVVNWPEATGLHSYDNVKMKKLIQNARNEGYDTIRIKNMREGDVEHELENYLETPHDQIAVLNPAMIRSEFAQFDPARQHENDIGARKGGTIDRENVDYKKIPHSPIVEHALGKIGAPLPASMPLIGSLTGRRP